MYERFYRLRERPFALTPDPDYLYPSRVHKEALSYLRYGIESLADNATDTDRRRAAGFKSALPVPLDSVQEFRTTVAGQGAAQGRSSGGQREQGGHGGGEPDPWASDSAGGGYSDEPPF